VVLVANRGLLSVGNLEELDKLQVQIKADGSDVARYGDFADDLQVLTEVHTVDQSLFS
jgi:hypothetical protein